VSRDQPVLITPLAYPFFPSEPLIRGRKGKRAADKNKGQKTPDSSRHDQRVQQKLIHMYAARMRPVASNPPPLPSSAVPPSSLGPTLAGKSLRKNEYAAVRWRVLFCKIYYAVLAHYPPFRQPHHRQISRVKAWHGGQDAFFRFSC
jgi:hypothetical protein